VQGILTRNASVDISESLRDGLAELEKRVTLAYCSLKEFSEGNKGAYEVYAQHITSLQESSGVSSFLATMVNIGLNSIPLNDLGEGVQAMLELVEGYSKRLQEVLNG